MWRQSDNVPFEQSRNVPLTPAGVWDGRRTATDESSRKSSARNVAKSEEAVDHSEAGSRGSGAERPAMDDPRKAVARERTEGEGGTRLATEAEPFRGTGAVGYQRARLAGMARGEALPDCHNRRCDRAAVCPLRSE